MTWRDQLLPASFRGVPFRIDTHGAEYGRRIVTSEFPARDQPFNEDLGRRARKYQVEGYIVDPDYFGPRDAIIAACESNATAGTLVHPFLGRLNVRCESLRVREERTEGGIVKLSFSFVEDGPVPAPVSAADTSGSALAAIGSALKAVNTAFAVAFTIAGLARHGVLAAALIGGDLVDRILGLAGVPVAGLGAVQADLALAAADIGLALAAPDIFAGSVTSAFSDYGDAVVSYQSDAPALNSTSVLVQNDPSAGMIGLAASFAADYAVLPPAVTPDRIAEGLNQQAMTDLVNTAVALAVARIVALSEFDSANAAAAARETLVGLFDGPITRAADTDSDDLYRALIAARASSLADIAARGAALQPLTEYVTPRPRTVLSLAQLLYPDSAGLEESALDLITRNASVHPAFMPVSGEALAA